MRFVEADQLGRAAYKRLAFLPGHEFLDFLLTPSTSLFPFLAWTVVLLPTTYTSYTPYTIATP